MAVIQSEFSFSASPKWKGIFEATETGRNGSSVTFKIVAKLKLDGTTSSTFYGYAVNWRATLNGVSSGLLKVKDASPRWYGGEAYRTFTTTLTTSVGASGGTVPLKIEVLASGGGNVSLSKTYNVSYSTWNTPPSMSGSLSLNRSGTIAENIGDVTLSWTKATDSNNNLSGYQIYRYVNGSHNATFDVGASVTSYKDTISSFGQGTKIYYKIWAKDSYGEWSGALTSATITKNTMTSATLNISGSIGFNTKTVSVSYSGASNTNGNTSFSYTLSSSNITVYNGSAITGTPFNLTIVRDGETKPSTPYILFNDVKTFTSGGSNWQRSITFKLDTKNGYGTTKNTTKAINSDLRIEPIAPSTITTSGKITLADARTYYIPDRGNITVAWSGASDRLGGSLKYDVYGKLGSGSYTILKSGLTGTSTTVTLGAVTSASNYTFKVVAITSYSKSSSLEGVPIELHYYKAPSIDFNNLNRTANGLTVDVVTKANTSIPSVGFTKRAYSGVVSGTLTKTPQTVSASNLADDKTYTLKVNITDDTGLSAEQTKSLTIPVYTPIMAVREKGVGVNAIPDGSAKLLVKGGTKTDSLIATGTIEGTQLKASGNSKIATIGTGGSDVYLSNSASGKYLQLKDTGVLSYDDKKIYHEGFAPDKLSSKGNLNPQTGRTQNHGDIYSYNSTANSNTGSPTSHSSTIGFGRGTMGTVEICGEWTNGQGLWVRALRDVTDNWFPWQRVYTTAYKPSWGDIQSKPTVLTDNGTGGRLTLSNWYYSTGNTGWYNSTYGGGWYMTDANWLRAYGNKGIYSTGTARITTGEHRYIRANENGSYVNIDIVSYDGKCIAFNPSASSGANIIIDRSWSGSSGTEPSFKNNKGNGWGFIGNSGHTFYRVYGAGGSVSDRAKKYEITKSDIETQYDNVKHLNVYNYRSISTSDTPVEELAENYFNANFIDVNGDYIASSKNIDGTEYDQINDTLSPEEIKELRIKEIIEKNPNFGECKREDLSLGCMIDEMPLETTFYDNEGGDGKAVDMYSYTTMILGATKHLINKVETLEAENEELKNRLDRMEELINGIINKG